MLEPGFMVDHYRIQEPVDQSRSAKVIYRALDTQTGVVVALTTPKREYSWPHDGTANREIQRAGRYGMQLAHPHIMPVQAVGEFTLELPRVGGWGTAEEKMPYYVTPYMEGETVYVRMQRGRLVDDDVVRIVTHSAAALDFCHAQTIVHCNVKPALLLMTAAGPVLLAGFGIAWDLSSAQEAGRRFAGTSQYMAPEQVRAGFAGDQALLRFATDQYALGVVAYELVTGVLPFSDPIMLPMAHVIEEPPHPREHHPALSEDVATVLLKVLAKEPEERFPSCGAFAEAFAAALLVEDDSWLV